VSTNGWTDKAIPVYPHKFVEGGIILMGSKKDYILKKNSSSLKSLKSWSF
jgi:hypothetical protein